MFELALIIIVVALVGNIVMFVKNVKAAKEENKEIEARVQQNRAKSANTSTKKNSKKKK